ncbi:MAG: hypothetical protein EPO39_06500 [Candidatus Manganitrophaceae bacterium]|nr:MAG: hypothetical protein EPO39_06500 [Candidatus Manganitrophaceae bacterium]
MKISFKFLGLAVIGLMVTACGGGGSGDGGSDETVPTLGITSIQKVGATAIPNANTSSKPVFASKLFDGGWILGPRHAFAQVTPCATDAPTSFAVSGGKIWINQAYTILDEVEFNREPSTTPSPEFGPFALDLTNTDANVGEAITVDIPQGNYSGVKYRIKRIEDDVNQPIKNVESVSAFRGKLVGDPKRRPSVWVEGVIGVGSEGEGFSSCKDFIFVADHRWEVRIPLRSASAGSTAVNAVLFFDLEGAFKSGMSTSGATAQGLVGEVGAGTVDNMGPQFLDGRTKDSDHGTPAAKAITAALPSNVKVFSQSVTATRGFDDNPSVSDLVNSTAPAGATVIDDSAVRVSGDDNPSVSDLAETEIPG